MVPQQMSLRTPLHIFEASQRICRRVTPVSIVTPNGVTTQPVKGLIVMSKADKIRERERLRARARRQNENPEQRAKRLASERERMRRRRAREAKILNSIRDGTADLNSPDVQAVIKARDRRFRINRERRLREAPQERSERLRMQREKKRLAKAKKSVQEGN